MIKKRALITGAGGFVGGVFRKYLAKDGWDVSSIDIKKPWSLSYPPWEQMDCMDLFRDETYRFDLVVHLAAIVGGRMTIENEPLKVASDLAIDSAFFNWAIRTAQMRVVYYSSSAAYPIHLQQKPYKLKESDIDLKDIRMPDMSYGWSKLSGEMLAEYARAEGLNVHVFRPFSGYGDTQSSDYPYPELIRRGKHKKDPFQIWGDGEQVRDFMHMDDIVAATMAAVELDIQEPVNLGTGIPTSFNQLAQMICQIKGYSPEFEHLTDKPVGVQYRCADATLMRSFYEPKTSLEEAVARSLSPWDV